MDNLNRNEDMHSYENEGCNWVPEYGAWMIEATPSRRKFCMLSVENHIVEHLLTHLFVTP